MGYTHGLNDIGVLIGKESTPGSEASSITKKLGLIQDLDGIELEYEPRKIWSLQNRQMAFAKSGLSKFSWQARFIVQNWAFLYYALGSESVSGTGPYTHTLSFADTLPSYSAEIMAGDLNYSRKFLGSKVDELVINAVKGEEIVAEMTWLAMSASKDTTPQTPSEDSNEPWVFDEVSLLTVNSVEKIDVAESFRWSLKHNLSPKHTLGSKNPRFIAEGRREHEITLDIHTDDSDIIDLVLNETEFQLQIKFVRTASSDEATITFGKCRVFKHDMKLGEETIMETIPVVVIDDPTVSVIDSIASYA